VGRGVAFDEYVEFEVKDGKILYEGDESEITAGKMRVEFIKVTIYEVFVFKDFCSLPIFILSDIPVNAC
jgi:hypothetical protein